LTEIHAATRTVRSVSRALDILFALERGPKSVTILARETGLSAVTTRRILGSLVLRDLVIQDSAASGYRLGPGLFRSVDPVVRGASHLPAVRVTRPEHEGAVRSVARASNILLALSEGPQSLGRIAERTALTKSTAHRLLPALLCRQMVIQDKASGDYLMGPGALRIAARAR
jgi:DNA-binding IclR family transcriptional regulator